MIIPCQQCFAEVLESELTSLRGERVCRRCASAERGGLSAVLKHPVGITGAVAVGLPFFLSFHRSSTVTVNGQVTAHQFIDYPAVAGGVVGLVCGVLLAVVLAKREGTSRWTLPALLLVLGGVQLARGFGVSRGLAEDVDVNRNAPTAAAFEPSLPGGDCTDDDLPGCQLLCDDGHLQACVTLGVAYDNARGVPQDSARAAALFEKACDFGEPDGCHNLAVLMATGRGGVQPDPARDFQLREVACRAGWGASCDALGVRVDNGVGVPKDTQKAREYFDRACELGHAQGCSNLALVLRRAGPDQDKSRAVHAAERACTFGNAIGCHEAAIGHYRGDDGTPDDARAFDLSLRACEFSVADACINVGVAFRDGLGVQKNLDQAKAYLQRACDAKSTGGCERLASLEARERAKPRRADRDGR